ncbi:MAG: M14 family metallopeptidase [Candidatus Saccharicenans sp.]
MRTGLRFFSRMLADRAILILIASSLIILTFNFSLNPALPSAAQEIISLTFRPAPEIIQDYQLDPLLEKDGRVYFVVNKENLSRLRQVMPEVRLETENFKHLFQTRAALPGQISLSSAGGLNGAYHSYSEAEAELKSLAASFPNLARLYVLGQSLEKRKIYALKISDNPAFSENEPGLALIGCHHAREWISVEIPLLTGKYLLENYAGDERLKNIVNRSQIWIIPVLNPDGLQYSILNYRLWRKNRRLNPDGSFGVDLNRNYSYQWGCDNQGSSPEPSSDVYRGPAPFSEPETLALSRLFLDHQFSAAISFHSYSQSILYPWGYADFPTEDEALMEFLAEQMSTLIFQVHGRKYQVGRSSSSLYLTNGDFTDWVYGLFKIPALTVELPPVDFLSGGFFNSESDIQDIFEENLPSVLFLAEWAIANFPAGKENSEKLKEKLEEKGLNLVKKKSKLYEGKE